MIVIVTIAIASKKALMSIICPESSRISHHP
jgi:hypothetical protein